MCRTAHVAILFSILALTLFEPASAQIMIGGPNGVVVGGGRGLSIGGRDGVNFRRGFGLRFGPPSAGVQLGGGYGARFGTPYEGLQIGGGQGFRAGTPYEGLQMGAGQGFQAGIINSPNVPMRVQPDSRTPAPGPAGTGAMISTPGPAMNAPRPLGPSPAQPTAQTGTNRQPSLQVPLQADDAADRQPIAGAGQAPRRVPGMIVLRNPASTGRSVRYTINGSPFQLAAGDDIRMNAGQPWRIGIPVGNGKTEEFVVQKEGQYTLSRTESGWSIESDNGQPEADSKSAPDESSQNVQINELPAPEVIDAGKPLMEVPQPTESNSQAVPPSKPTAKTVPESSSQDSEKSKQPPKSVLEFNDSKSKGKQ
jgi:hypothetical protein